jgi:hypothetical protein
VESEIGENVQNISVERAVDILSEHGESITLEEARAVVEFMYNLANLALNQYLGNENSRFIYSGEHR